MLRTIDNGIVLITSWVVASLTGVMCIVVLLGVFTRYVLNDALPWTEEAARFALLWMSWLGGGLAVRKGAHIAAEFVIDRLRPNVRAGIVFVGQLGVIFFLAICVWYGFGLFQRVSFQSTVALGVTMQLPYAAVPVGSALMIYHMLIVMLRVPGAVTRDSELQV
jgi:TRAP-type C4-dicarboxylate transport system permease small subunit